MLLELLELLMDDLGLSRQTAQEFIAAYGELEVQRHMMYTEWMMDQGKVKSPPAWFTASLKGKWNAPVGMPEQWKPKVITIRVSEDTFARMQVENRKDEKELRKIVDQRLDEAGL